MKQPSKKTRWIGQLFSIFAALPFLPSGIMKLMGAPQVVQGFDHFGWPQSALFTVGILELTSVIFYLIPSISVLGAVLLTGFLGGAIATHMRMGEPVYFQITLGLFIWGGLFLREPRLRVLLPVRGKDFTYTRTIVINAPVEKVYAYLKQLKNFRNWNPFLKKDPNPNFEYRVNDGQPGFILAWSGNKEVGSGEQEITKTVDHQLIEFEMRFKTPFEATNVGCWRVQPVESNQTQVTWSMMGETIFDFSSLHEYGENDR